MWGLSVMAFQFVDRALKLAHATMPGHSTQLSRSRIAQWQLHEMAQAPGAADSRCTFADPAPVVSTSESADRRSALEAAARAMPMDHVRTP